MVKYDISDFFSQLDWDEDTETLLASWADIGACYTWLYDHAYRRYDKINFGFSLPIFVFSTVTGTLVMSLASILSQEEVSRAQFALGAVNIFTGILSSIQNNYKFSALAEANLNASRGWSKFERNIKIQLTLVKKNRKSAEEFCRDCREEYERLLDISPVINTSSIQSFKKKFKDNDLIKPEILDKIEKTLTSSSKSSMIDDLLHLKKQKEGEREEKIKIELKDQFEEELIEYSIQKNIQKNIQNTEEEKENSVASYSINIKSDETS